ncbi:MAG: VWA domain-containing protein [Terriglobales bacterium]
MIALLAYGGTPVLAQVPYLGRGPDAAFQQVDFSQMYLDQINRNTKQTDEQKAQNQKLVDSGVVSALDLAAPNKAVEEYNRAATLMKAQHSKEAAKDFRRAIEQYPKFVSAHIGLGLAYLDLEDAARAKSEFEAAAKLDDKFPGSFAHLGQLALSQNDFGTARSALEKAVSVQPQDVQILSGLAYAQNGTHEYRQALDTARQVHALGHKGFANVHYVAASAAMALNDYDAMERELRFFLSEDPTNAFAPVARQNLAALTHNKSVLAADAAAPQLTTTPTASPQMHTFPNSERLKAQLTGLGDESENESCDDCDKLAEAQPVMADAGNGEVSDLPQGLPVHNSTWTIRKSVDEVTLFFAVSSHGHMVNGLQQSDIQIRDDGKPPEKIMQFAPQSKLPLRLALLVDTSGSVHDRFSFEKHAAAKFVEKMLSNASDLAFIAGFASEPTVTQDFSAEPAELGKGIEKLTNGGGTALFDAISFACWKLAAYPEHEQVARVLVILSDGEDNSSHSSLKQSIQVAERTGVTIYTVSTREDRGDKTDADKVLEVLAERSGGDAMFPGDMHTLSASFDKLHDLIRSRYFIAYKPADFQPNGNYHTIDVIAEKDGKRLQVRARKGYHARLESIPR